MKIGVESESRKKSLCVTVFFRNYRHNRRLESQFPFRLEFVIKLELRCVRFSSFSYFFFFLLLLLLFASVSYTFAMETSYFLIYFLSTLYYFTLRK